MNWDNLSSSLIPQGDCYGRPCCVLQWLLICFFFNSRFNLTVGNEKIWPITVVFNRVQENLRILYYSVFFSQQTVRSQERRKKTMADEGRESWIWFWPIHLADSFSNLSWLIQDDTNIWKYFKIVRNWKARYFDLIHRFLIHLPTIWEALCYDVFTGRLCLYTGCVQGKWRHLVF